MLRINYLTPKLLWHNKMSVGRRLCVESVARANYLQVYHEPTFDADVLWCYKTGGMNLHEVDIPKVVVFNEANDPSSVMRDLADTDATMCMFHHRGDYDRWKSPLREMGIDSWSQPHAAAIGTASERWSDRSGFAILTGVINEDVYPLRSRLKSIAKGGHFPAIVLDHPGYRMVDEKAVKDQYAGYVRELSRHKVSLCCTSRFKYPLAKLYESAAAGCVIVTDKPDCPVFESTIWPYCIQIDESMSDHEIIDKIKSYSDDQLKMMARRSRSHWFTHFTLHHWSSRFLKSIKEIVE